jgi:antitoxin MazE
MAQTIGMWGNNLAIRIPREIKIFERGENVELVPVDEGLLIRPTKRRRSMAELMAGEKGIFDGELIEFGEAAGDEAEL